MRTVLKKAFHSGLMLSISAFATFGSAERAMAWGAPGHQYVGNLGFELLNPSARAQVLALLGPRVNLGQAAVWPDCIRSVSGSPSTTFRFQMTQYTARVCGVFDDNGSEEARMIDYARRNWTNCEYSGHRTQCHLSFHFADVNVYNRTNYSRDYFGTGDQDVVQAINAAITVLRCEDGHVCPVAPPFNILDKREALFLLAHFIGDVHQPLHVGAVYLDGNNSVTGDNGRETVGGNYLLLTPGNTGSNLHHEWDTILGSLGTSPSAAVIASGCLIAPLPNPPLQRPEDWASESVAAARTAYLKIAFSPDAAQPRYWDIRFEDAARYAQDRQAVQARQLILGGARLAATLNAIWPSNRRATACAPSMRHSRS